MKKRSLPTHISQMGMGLKILIPVFLILLTIAICINIHREQQFNKIVCGMTKDEVVKVLGNPSRVYDGFVWGYDSEAYTQSGRKGPANQNVYSLVIVFDGENRISIKNRMADIRFASRER